MLNLVQHLTRIEIKIFDNYNILDEEFKNKFYNGLNPLKKRQPPDKILAYVQYKKELKNGEEKLKSINILEVYKLLFINLLI